VKAHAVVRFISSHRGWPAFNNYLFIFRLAAYTSLALFPGSTVMPIVSAFHSIDEMKKPPRSRVCHNNGLCRAGRDIPQSERKSGDGGHKLCEDCSTLKAQGR
jgi:hypothetical protein